MTLLGSAEIASELISALAPFDAIESDHRTRAMTWLRETDDVCRRRKPATPSPHLVSYFVPLDPTERRMLLVEHRLAGLWLPPGGHVEPGEHPVATVFREATEELDLAATLLNGQTTPFFLTWTQTVGANSHIDVSLWYLLHGEADRELDWDRREFASVRWWSPDEVLSMAANRFDPNIARFIVKLDATGIW